ncbi:sensor histidine kinase [Paenibacillus sp. FSL R5-0887]|uniref:histidine kinase n=1 Tax=Paenibacillus odorifer TaxID=189426 RepID=A0ABX3GRR8_9BACL|nr:sensor histidine kinase [Paenibacillus odorifer]OMC76246.1 two-component sensor histidine kinase [Paenibacillus odorifer]OMD35605.1 two-component sensor histidine kinase [Paenibacillus odorifer]OMD75388.1 two-component sensor histidine kinase [Paenibacillus odorifer]OMD87280.1 two-component sensor histidine kinase [Paenibacillus odorifer]OME08564.1 two-component sensor histidine kinase [Paenibacillus odorifer]
MIAVLGVVIVLLLAVIVWQYQNSRKASNDLRYMHDKLSSIMEEGSHERLLLFSGNLELQSVLIDLNRLLDINHKGSIERVRLEKSMRNMLSNISHDLKTPLTVVLGYIETIQQDEHLPAGERERMMKMIHQKANEVIQLMNKFFDLSKLESGDREIALSRVEAGEVCRRNILSFYDILSAKGSEVEIEIPDEAVYFMGNEEALDRILSNLLSNAISYGDAGSVLGLKLYSDENKVYIEVWDRGKGISEVHQDKVFERLYTLEDSRNRAYQGSGLGLTITKRLTEQMNGTITLVSQPYVRTVFTLTFRRLRF